MVSSQGSDFVPAFIATALRVHVCRRQARIV